MDGLQGVHPINAAPIDVVLANLTKVRQRQTGQWTACCPAHPDTNPSLSVRETPDGSVLLHCFAGCTVGSVLDALGLDTPSLYPPRQRSGNEPTRVARLLTPSQALQLLNDEAHLIAVAGANVTHGVILTEADLHRVVQATARIRWLLEESTLIGGSNAQ